MLHNLKFEIMLIILIILIINTIQIDGCTKIDVTITQKIENEGFHREINWLIEKPQSYNCKFCLQLTIPEGLYVNPDEIFELNRTGQLKTIINGDVNVEIPMHLAEKHTIKIYLPDKNRITLKIPIHLRYQRAQINGKYGKVTLAKPSLLANCQNDVSCMNFDTINAPCAHNFQQNCIWNNITYQTLFDDTELFVPIGNLDDYPLISIVTLLLGCAGCIYILSILSTTNL